MKDWKNMTKRGLALLLTLVLCAGILQLPVLAADESAGTVQDAAIQDVTEETVTPSRPYAPADTTAPDADAPEDDTAPSDFSSKIPEAIEPPVTLDVPKPPMDNDIKNFYKERNVAVIVRCIDTTGHNGTLSRLAKSSYRIGEVETYDGSNPDLSTDEWFWMCKVHVDQEYYLKLWTRNFESKNGTHYKVSAVDANDKGEIV